MGTALVVEETKCSLVKVVNEYGIVVMQNVILRGKCYDGSPIIQKPGQKLDSPTKEALIIEKNGKWRVLTQNHNGKRGENKNL